MAGEIQNALTIPTDTLIGRLEEVRKEHEKAREDAEWKAAEARKELLGLVERLSPDQVANILNHFINSRDDELKKWLVDVHENEKFKTLSTTPTAVETSLERLIRILRMASDKEIQVKPTDAVYSYL